jgi:hypothetical protein
MLTKKVITALAVGIAGVFALSATTSAFAKTKYPRESYETMGAKEGSPPVPGFAMWRYQPGKCWKVSNADKQFGDYVECSKWHKRR